MKRGGSSAVRRRPTPPHALHAKDVGDDVVDAWEAENWCVIKTALEQAEASFRRGDYAEFDIKKFQTPRRSGRKIRHPVRGAAR